MKILLSFSNSFIACDISNISLKRNREKYFDNNVKFNRLNFNHLNYLHLFKLIFFINLDMFLTNFRPFIRNCLI